MPNSTASKKLLGSLVALIVLSVCLCLTTFALVYSMVSLENNIFKTGFVKIDLNGGQPIIKDNELLFAPGMTVEKEFYIKNEGSCDVYFRLYFENVTGSLASTLNVSILDGDTVLYTGTAEGLSKKNPTQASGLAFKEQRVLTAVFTLPVGNNDNLLQNQNLTFDLHADAVQAQNNNPDHPLFD